MQHEGHWGGVENKHFSIENEVVFCQCREHTVEALTMDLCGGPVNNDVIGVDGPSWDSAKRDIMMFWKQLGAELNPNAMRL